MPDMVSVVVLLPTIALVVVAVIGLAIIAGWAYCMLVSPFTSLDCSDPFKYFWHGVAILFLITVLGLMLGIEVEAKK